MEKAKKAIKTIFIIRICLWVVAAVSTVYWIWYSFKLTWDGIFDPYEYSSLLRPVMYTGIVVAVVAILLAFLLRRITVEIKRQNGIRG